MKMLASRMLLLTIVAVLGCTVSISTANVIADSVADLSWAGSGGASSSVSGDTLTITTSKNSDVMGTMSESVSIPNAADVLTVTADITLDTNFTVDENSRVYVGFFDSASGYGYYTGFEPQGGDNTGIFEETNDTNLGKFNTNAFGTTTHTLAFTLTKIDTDTGMNLGLDSDLVNTAGNTVDRNADIDVSNGTTTFDTVHFCGRAVAVIVEFGTPGAHCALMARQVGIPVVGNIPEVVAHISHGASVLVDGLEGTVVVNPDEETVRFQERRKQYEAAGVAAKARAHEAAVTVDGVTVQVAANITSRMDTELAVENGADGVGLFRTEALFMYRNALPSGKCKIFSVNS